MKATIIEVAREAGVSAGTVSRALRGHSSVTEEKVRRVNEAARALDYTPLRRRSAPASTLPLQDKTIALVLLGLDRSLATLPVVAEAIGAAQSALTQAGASTLLVDAPDLCDIPATLSRNAVDGAILKGALQGDLVGSARTPLMNFLRTLPGVWLLGRPSGCWGDAVSSDDFAVGKMAAEYLVGRGHRELAVVNPKSEHTFLQQRTIAFSGYAELLGARVQTFTGGHPELWSLPLHSMHDRACLRDLVEALLNSNPRPTAIFAPADAIAALLYREFAERKLQIGRDISILGCNHEPPLTGALHPDLTTLDIHAAKLGALAVEQMIWRLLHSDFASTDTSLTPTLIEGHSVFQNNR